MSPRDDDDRDENGYPRGIGMANNYGVQNGNGTAIIKWVAASAGTCFIAVIAYLFIDNVSIRKEASDDRKALTEQLTLIRERLVAIEITQKTGCNP